MLPGSESGAHIDYVLDPLGSYPFNSVQFLSSARWPASTDNHIYSHIINNKTVIVIRPILRATINRQLYFLNWGHGRASEWARSSSRTSTTPRRVVTERAGLRPPRCAPKGVLHAMRIFRRRVRRIARRPGTSVQPGVRVYLPREDGGTRGKATPPAARARWVREVQTRRCLYFPDRRIGLSEVHVPAADWAPTDSVHCL